MNPKVLLISAASYSVLLPAALWHLSFIHGVSNFSMKGLRMSVIDLELYGRRVKETIQ